MQARILYNTLILLHEKMALALIATFRNYNIEELYKMTATTK